jgi:hypothetical protein
VLCRTDDQNAFLDGAEIVEGEVMGGQDGSGVCEYSIAKFGERDAATRLLDDGPADDRLNASDVLAHCGLSHVENGRRTVKSATIRDRDDAPQRCDVEYGSHDANIL